MPDQRGVDYREGEVDQGVCPAADQGEKGVRMRGSLGGLLEGVQVGGEVGQSGGEVTVGFTVQGSGDGLQVQAVDFQALHRGDRVNSSLIIETEATPGAVGAREQPQLRVIVNGAGGDPGLSGELPDAE
nr:hypothetical protein [Actinoplanes derwentensis]GID89229.1 hypothetical protein Ade03nite_81530 [Actinoplanes derwentensis]